VHARAFSATHRTSPASRPGRRARSPAEPRRNWLQQALAATTGCDLIFADPDNGIRPVAHREPAHRTKAVKHVYLNELAAFAQRGQSVIVYHHAARSAAVDSKYAVGWPTSPPVCP